MAYTWTITNNAPTVSRIGGNVVFTGVAGSSATRTWKVTYSQNTNYLTVGSDSDWNYPSAYCAETYAYGSSAEMDMVSLQSGTWYYRQMYKTSSNTIYYNAIKSFTVPSGYSLTLALSTGISSIKGKLTLTSSSTTGLNFELDSIEGSYQFRNLAAGNSLYVSNVYYETGYTYPVTATNQAETGVFTMINSSGNWVDHYITMPSNSRICIIYPTEESQTTLYQFQIYRNHSSSDTAYYYTTSYPSTLSTYSFTVPTAPSRSGYTFVGFNETRTGSGEFYQPFDTVYLTSTEPSCTLASIWHEAITVTTEIYNEGTTFLMFRATGIPYKVYDRTVIFTCNGNEYLVPLSAYSTSSNVASVYGLSAGSGYTVETKIYFGNITKWSTYTYYQEGDVVRYALAFYKCTTSHYSSSSFSSSYWTSVSPALVGSDTITAYTPFDFAWTNVIASGVVTNKMLGSDWTDFNRYLYIKGARHNVSHSIPSTSAPFGTIQYNRVRNTLYSIKTSYDIGTVSNDTPIKASKYNDMVNYLNDSDN